MRADISMRIAAHPGLNRARARIQAFDETEIDWQIEVIRENTIADEAPRCGSGRSGKARRNGRTSVLQPAKKAFIAEADKIADELSRCAIRRGPGAAWIGLDWLGDAEVFPARLPWTGSLQRRFRHRAVSCRARGGYGTAIFCRTRARRRRASAKKSEKPQCGANGPLSRRRRRHGPGLDRLCAHRDVEVLRRRTLCLRTLMSRRTVQRWPHCGRQTAGCDRRQRRGEFLAFFVSIGTANRPMYSIAQSSAASI